MDAETVTRFWLHVGVGVGVGVGVADGVASGAAAVEPPVGLPVEETWSELPLKAPATAKPPKTIAATISRAAPTNSLRRRYTAGLGVRPVREPDADALPRADDVSCLPILLG